MIEKERLEELIEQGATIYEAKYNHIEAVDLSKRKLDFISEKYNMVRFEPKINERWKHHKYFDKLFETEEEAEWEIEFGKVERTERLSLPTWEYWKESSKFGMYCMSFFDKNNHYCELQILETIKVVKWGYGRTIEFENAVSKENYIEACNLCKKLFLGEEL